MVKVKLLLFIVLILIIFIFLSCPSLKNNSSNYIGFAGPANTIIDHTCINLNSIPAQAIINAKNLLHIGYGHTSHGSQLTTGMAGLDAFKGGTGLYLFNSSGNEGALHLYEGDGYGTGDLDHDCGYYPNWVNETREFLGAPEPDTGRGTSHSEFNIIIWSWCGQASSKTETTMRTEYLEPMAQLEADYPGIAFVYMTGHMDSDGFLLTGNLHERNEQIRAFCRDNYKWLYDFNDIEAYNPAGVYFGDKLPDDNCDYDTDGELPREEDGNWATEWQDTHTVNFDWYNCSPAHTQALNGNLKAYAAWWLWARLAGWSGE